MARNAFSRCNGKAHKSVSKAARIESNREKKQLKHMVRHPNDAHEERNLSNRTRSVECCICGCRLPFARAVHTMAGVFCKDHANNPHSGASYDGVKLSFPDGYRDSLPVGA